MYIYDHKDLLGCMNPNDILPKTRVRLLMENDFLYYLYAPCSGESVKIFYYRKMEKIKDENDARKLIDHLMNMRKDNLHKILGDEIFLNDLIEGLTFDLNVGIEKYNLIDYIAYEKYRYHNGR